MVDSGVFFLGGSPCCGKSHVAEMLAERYGLAHYQIDIKIGEAMRTLDPERYPNLVRWWAMRSDARWLQSQERLMDDVLACYREQFDWVLADIEETTCDALLLVEGSPLLPSWLSERKGPRVRAAWMVPSEAFQREHYGRRAFVAPFLGDCSDPEQAFENWMRRDAAYAQLVTEQTGALDLPLLVVDGGDSVGDAAAWVARRLGLGAGTR